MEIIETSVFTRIIQELLTDDEYAELQLALIRNPAAGAINRNSGGLRIYAGLDRVEESVVASE